MTRDTLKFLTAAIAVVALVGASACSSHDDLPTALSITAPPTPAVTDVVDNGNGTYDIFWTVDNASVVDYYRVYSLSFGSPVLEDTTSAMTFGISTIVPVGGVVIGVSAVTVENVEGAMGTGVTPEPGGP